ncbi:hypothetical protein [Pseudooceanicola nanhaiensis]|uniref:hypothetical protein n=1 Tax=Pseudooceanicola nanhaiensis TaxID=375761 RepID=UPI001CD2191D|nr:hypothetical protein [Pseudooceanicola nanhaiensis]MCA0922964.1 hypothetical protein [Pseudooceanicola nanhaiensis]
MTPSRSGDHKNALKSKRRRPRPPKITASGENPTDIQMPTDEELAELYGVETAEMAHALFQSSILALGPEGAPYREMATFVGIEEKPQSAFEAMLQLQMVTTHAAMTRAAFSLNSSKTLNPTYMKMMLSAQTTFLRQLEALRRMRGGGSQTVRIEHVHVNDGGQAIVGAVGGAGGAKADER